LTKPVTYAGNLAHPHALAGIVGLAMCFLPCKAKASWQMITTESHLTSTQERRSPCRRRHRARGRRAGACLL